VWERRVEREPREEISNVLERFLKANKVKDIFIETGSISCHDTFFHLTKCQ
jgi:hypothetical protein